MKVLLCSIIFSVVLSVSVGTLPARSQPILLSQKINFLPPDLNAPYNRHGGTHAGAPPCGKNRPMIALMPPTNLGLTVSESPAFFAYVSLTSFPVQFDLQTEDGIEVYTTTFKVDKPGIVEVRIPPSRDNKKYLEVGKRYQWSFAMICEPEDRSSDGFIQGFVERIEPSQTLNSELANADPMARAIAYAKNGIWYDTVSTLADMRRQAPDDANLIAEWKHLLQSQNLDEIAAQPLVQSF
ncbi:MAG: DUF928 domain-containing protein [Microcoleus sp.]